MQFAYRRFLNLTKMRLRHSVIKVEVAAGEALDVSEEILHEGNVTHVAFYTDNKPSESVAIQIEGSEGEIHPFVNYREYETTGGKHKEAKKEFEISGGRKIKVTAKADGNLVEIFKGEMLFVIETN